MTLTELALALIRCPSVTPVTAGVFDVIEGFLVPLGFTSQRMTFTGNGGDAVENIYLRLGTQSPNFCFAGHTDVVPPGDLAAWNIPPFEPRIENGVLYGRGAEDMKGAVAAFMVAAKQFAPSLRATSEAIQQKEKTGLPRRPALASGDGATPRNDGLPGSISLLITQNEEGDAINGTREMLSWLAERGEKIDACIVGEPTNVERLGDMVKIGRRGSIRFQLTVNGKQGHAAYPERADNPVTRIVNMLHALKNTKLDDGYETTNVSPNSAAGSVVPSPLRGGLGRGASNLSTTSPPPPQPSPQGGGSLPSQPQSHGLKTNQYGSFPPSNLEITSVDVGNPTANVIPATATAKFNVRFNPTYTAKTIEAWVRERIAPFGNYELKVHLTGEAFLTRDEKLIEVVSGAVKNVTGITPTLSTTGGTSDARFIKDVCPVVEFGTTGLTPHMVNECVAVEVLEGLAKVYGEVLRGYFAR